MLIDMYITHLLLYSPSSPSCTLSLSLSLSLSPFPPFRCYLLYGMKGTCDKANGYTLPGPGTKHGKTARNALGGGQVLIEEMFQGSYDDLKALATMNELASYEWKEEFQAMLGAWDNEGKSEEVLKNEDEEEDEEDEEEILEGYDEHGSATESKSVKF